MLDLSSDAIALLAVSSAGVSVILLGVVLVVGLRLRKLRRDYRRAFRGVDTDIADVLGVHSDQLTSLREDLGQIRADAGQLRELQRGALSRIGVVRYDAFDDMGGMLSFSAALLDERGDGLVISAINGRTETRCYSKPISSGTSEQNLSGEEAAAIDAAVQGRPPSAYPPETRRRRRAS